MGVTTVSVAVQRMEHIYTNLSNSILFIALIRQGGQLSLLLYNVYTDELNYLQSRETQDVTLPIVALTILAMLMIWCYLHQPYQHCRSYKTFVIISTDLMILYITRLKLCV